MGGLVINSYYEIYLLQNAIMVIISSISFSFAWMWLFTMMGTLLMGMIMNKFNNRITNLVLK